MLLLHHELMLLALRDREGTIVTGSNYAYGLGGAILAELLLRGKIGVDAKGRRKLAQPLDAMPLGDDVIDECLERIHGAKRRASLQTWVSRFSGLRKLRHRIAAALCERGILRADEDKVLLLFRRRIYPELDPGPERELLDRLRNVVLTDTEEVDARTVVALSLTQAAGMLGQVVDKPTQKARRERIERIVNGELTGAATREAIEAMQAAVLVATILPAIMASTIHH